MTKWAQSLIRISNYEVETLQKRLAEISTRRATAEMRLAVLDAERGRFPAIDVLKSVSRTMPDCQTPEERELNKRARLCLSSYANMEELIRIGAYRAGSDPIVDRSIALNPALEEFLGQAKDDYTPLNESFARLGAILNQGMIQETAG